MLISKNVFLSKADIMSILSTNLSEDTLYITSDDNLNEIYIAEAGVLHQLTLDPKETLDDMVTSVTLEGKTLTFKFTNGMPDKTITLDTKNKTEMDALIAAKQDKLTAGAYIDISDDNVISYNAEKAEGTFALKTVDDMEYPGYGYVITNQEEFDIWVNTILGQDTAVGGKSTVYIKAGVYHANKSIYIQGLTLISAYGVTVDAKGGAYSVFSGKSSSVRSECKVEGITVTGSKSAGYGGGASYCNNWVNCTVTGNTDGNTGGARDCDNWVNCTVTGNTGSYSGGASYCDNWVNCTVTGNTGNSSGGARDCDNWVNCTVTDNNSSFYSGAAYCDNWVNCYVTSNTATSVGAGARACNNWIGCTVKSNTGTNNISNCTNWRHCHYDGTVDSTTGWLGCYT